MTDMKRVTISVPDNMDSRIISLKKDDRFIRCSYSEIVRKLLELGLKKQSEEDSA